MTQPGLELDLKQIILSGAPLSDRDVDTIRTAIAEDASHFRALREAAQELELKENRDADANLRLGIAYFFLGRYPQAVATLSAVPGSALALFFQARAHHALEQFSEAAERYREAAAAGYSKDLCVLGMAESMRNAGDTHGALKQLDELSGPVEQTAEYLYQRGATVSAIGGNPHEVVALFERAVESDPRHAGALFGLAIENDRRGNDETALDLYERSTAQFPPHVGSLLNLGLLYEDRNQYEQARRCFQRVLDVFPTHRRALLFFKDAEASGDMYYDEDAQRKRDRLSQVLSIPVTDFELSVRSRNCLTKMGVRTLGDLTRTTEQDLLASKNFGETSLVEIREMLQQKGLQLGQFAHEKPEPEPAVDYSAMSPDEQALLERPIADLNLSVRARKCMARLGLNTLGELIRKTGDDLLECKNFGVTSLNEVREKLTQYNLKLRGD